MFEFFKGVASAIASKTRKDDQILFSTDTQTLEFDISDGTTTTRYTVHDPLVSSLDGKTLLIL